MATKEVSQVNPDLPTAKIQNYDFKLVQTMDCYLQVDFGAQMLSRQQHDFILINYLTFRYIMGSKMLVW